MEALAGLIEATTEGEAETPVPSAWWVVFTRPQGEERAERGLRRRGLAVFRPVVPRRLEMRRRVEGPLGRVTRKVTIEVKRNLFPRYLFVGQAFGRSCWEIRDVEGVEAILYTDGRPALVSNAVVEDLKAAIDMGLLGLSTGAGRPVFAAGEHVEIRGSAMATLLAVVKSVLPNGSAEVVTRLLGCDNVVRVPLDRIRRPA